MIDGTNERRARVVAWQCEALRNFVAALAAEPAGPPSPWLREQFWMLEPGTRHPVIDDNEAGALFLDLIHPLSIAHGGPRTAASGSDAIVASAAIGGGDGARLARLLELIDMMD
ncbi:hypothetical protein EQZ23_06860 [Sphingomonas sp. UV9]|uniref:hypothetical protein n=1 Tax=Sphingomonas sp. UV9 TaxID=1851410 RepID=UPI000FFBD1FB|nr:hypothetical protein [Sphingomonas sp. UV9]RXD04856.1 hypothetical protein EQZ23_06860 [Sphingomonas sp. UV9]